jgi:hypothetical protein
MINYDLIDEKLSIWANERGYVIQTEYRGEPVRGVVVWSVDRQAKAEIGVNDIWDQNVELCIFAGRKKRKKLRGSISNIYDLMSQAEAVAKKWL